MQLLASKDKDPVSGAKYTALRAEQDQWDRCAADLKKSGVGTAQKVLTAAMMNDTTTIYIRGVVPSSDPGNDSGWCHDSTTTLNSCNWNPDGTGPALLADLLSQVHVPKINRLVQGKGELLVEGEYALIGGAHGGWDDIWSPGDDDKLLKEVKLPGCLFRHAFLVPLPHLEQAKRFLERTYFNGRSPSGPVVKDRAKSKGTHSLDLDDDSTKPDPVRKSTAPNARNIFIKYDQVGASPSKCVMCTPV